MDKSTKITIILLICVVGFLLLIRNPLVDFINQSLTKQELTTLNESLSMEGLSLGLSETVFMDTHLEYFDEFSGDKNRVLRHRSNGLEVMLSGYPYSDDMSRITSIETRYSKHSVYTIYPGMALDEATKILENRSYDVTDLGNHRVFSKYNIYFVLDYDNYRVSNLFLGLLASDVDAVE